MPYETYPDELPWPIAAPVRSDERRDLTEIEGPRAARPFQFAGQGRQSLRFRLSFAMSTVWDTWWRETLTFGGAWFLAPWSHPTAETVPRRFTEAPTWSLVPGYGWDVDVECEVLSTDQMPRATELPIWLDNFSGPAGSLNEVSHDQDIQLNYSFWDVQEGLVFSLDGIGNAVEGETGSYAFTNFDEFGNVEAPLLAPGWRFEMELDPIITVATSNATGIRIYDDNGNDFYLYVYTAVPNSTVTVEVGFQNGSVAYYDLPAGKKKFVVRTTETGFTVRINGDVFEEVESDTTLSPTSAEMSLPGEDPPSTGPRVLGRISRVALYGTVLPPEPLVPMAPLVEFDALDYLTNSGFTVTPPEEQSGSTGSGFNVDFNEDGELIGGDDFPGFGGRIGPNLNDSRIGLTFDGRVTGRSNGDGPFTGGVGFNDSSGMRAELFVDHDGTDYTVAFDTENGSEVSIVLPPEVDFAVNTEIRLTFDGADVNVYVDDELVGTEPCTYVIDFEASQSLVEVGVNAIINKASVTYLPV